MLYHYTQLQNFSKIFTDSGIRFRMYDSRWMNDPSESMVLQDFIIQYQDRILSELSPRTAELLRSAIELSSHVTPYSALPYFTYVLSFSTVSDSNIFWGSKYSGLSGFSVSIDDGYFVQENFKSIGYARLENVYYFKTIEGEPSLEDVRHVSEKLEVEISELVEVKDIPVDQLPYVIWSTVAGQMSIYYKHPSWAHEKEKRFVIVTRGTTNIIGWINQVITFAPIGLDSDGLNVYSDHALVDFENNSFPKPFIEISIPKTTVTQLTLGPSLKEIDREAVRNYLWRLNYVCKVLPSGAKIR